MLAPLLAALRLAAALAAADPGDGLAPRAPTASSVDSAFHLAFAVSVPVAALDAYLASRHALDRSATLATLGGVASVAALGVTFGSDAAKPAPPLAGVLGGVGLILAGVGHAGLFDEAKDGTAADGLLELFGQLGRPAGVGMVGLGAASVTRALQAGRGERVRDSTLRAWLGVTLLGVGGAFAVNGARSHAMFAGDRSRAANTWEALHWGLAACATTAGVVTLVAEPASPPDPGAASAGRLLGRWSVAPLLPDAGGGGGVLALTRF